MVLAHCRLLVLAVLASVLWTACTSAETKAESAPVAPTGAAGIAPTTESQVAPQGAGAQFDSARAWEHLRAQVAIGPRPAGSPALAETRRYISAQLLAAGLTVREQPFTGATPTGPIPMINLIAEIPGRRADRLILATHYDTKLFREFRFVGASDGASSTAVVLELARVLRTAQPEYTIELLFLDGEEAVVEWQGTDHTYGSRHYVQAAQQAGTLARIKALVLVDMVGDRDLAIRRDSNSTPWLVDLVWGSAAKLGYRSNFPDALTTVDDDHIPFVRAGVPSVDIIDLDYAAWHTPNDTLDQVSARSLQVVGDVILDALPQIQQQLAAARR